MENTTKIVLGGLLVIILGGLIWWGMQTGDTGDADTSTGETANIVYYYGEECPHCKNIAKFLEENKVAEKVEFVKKEVWHNPKNSREMSERAQKVCGLAKDKLGVPFVIADDKCFVGEPEVMGLFKQKAGIK